MSKPFTRPSQKKQLSAIGSLRSEPESIQKSFSIQNDHFCPIRLPEPDDWLGCHKEPGQSFEKFKQTFRGPSAAKKKIYMQPLGSKLGQNILNNLFSFAQVFFPGMTIILRAPISIEELNIKSRKNSGINQFNAGKILRKLQEIMPKDAYCLIGITLEDIYHNEQSNFVFGLGSAGTKTGVFSFARFDNEFYGEKTDQDILEFRAVKVMIHEICHMFGLSHCIYFSCLMNGSNHIGETDLKPFYLCPVCLRKLQYVLKFSVLDWYDSIHNLLRSSSSYFVNFLLWYRQRVEYLST